MGFVGKSVARPDDPLLLTGAARFVAELNHPDFLRLGGWQSTAHVAFVRSTIAHGEIVSIDTSAAADAPGVVAVVTSSDHSVVPHGSVFPDFYPPVYAMPILAEKRVRYVGEPIVAIVAESPAMALDATELVEVDFEVLDAVIDVNDAVLDTTKLFEPGSWARTRSTQDPSHSGSNGSLALSRTRCWGLRCRGCHQAAFLESAAGASANRGLRPGVCLGRRRALCMGCESTPTWVSRSARRCV